MNINQPNKMTATVGESGDFSDVQEALNNGFNKLRLVNDVTEDSNVIIPPGGLYVWLAGNTLTMGSGQFTFAGAYECAFYGDGPGISEIDYTQTVANEELFDDAGNGATVILENLTIDNNSSTADCEVARSTTIQKIQNVTLEAPNYRRCGFGSTEKASYINNLTIVGGGAGSANFVQSFAGILNGVYVSGPALITFFTNTSTSLSSNIIFSSTGYSYGKMLLNVVSAAGSNHLSPINGGLYANMSLGAGTINTGNAAGYHLLNIHTNGAFNSAVNAHETLVSNCYFGSTYQIAGDRNQYSNCHFVGNVDVDAGADMNQFTNCNFEGTIAVNGDNNTFVGCKVGADAGGGGNTITIASGVAGTIIRGCRTDGAIVNNGSGTIDSGNLVY